MQTFLPYSSYEKSAQILDRMRLGKQRVEAWQILRALRGETKGWVNHPATKMWRGHEFNLCQYGIAICAEWEYRGYQDTLLPKFVETMNDYGITENPWWLGHDPLHISHQSNLYRKDAEHYSVFADIGAELPYVWPTN